MKALAWWFLPVLFCLGVGNVIVLSVLAQHRRDGGVKRDGGMGRDLESDRRRWDPASYDARGARLLRWVGALQVLWLAALVAAGIAWLSA